MNTPKILLVEDNPDHRRQISRWLHEEGFNLDHAESGELALEKIKKTNYGVVLLDLQLPNMDGFGVLSEIQNNYPDICTIILTAYADTETVKRTLNAGAFDFFDKTDNYHSLAQRIENSIKRFHLKRERDYLQEETQNQYNFANIIGQSAPMLDVLKLVKKVAGTDSNVLITGESGTGKELIAKAIHHHSLRANKELIIADCGALAENLIESELFGHEKGAFTGAIKRKKGKIERAHQSTLFIDEIGEMSPGLQLKLLRFLQERTFELVGGEEVLHADVRIIVATNKTLEEEVANGHFREDLYYRLNVFPIHLPPLRDRKEDIPPLVQHFLKTYSLKLKKRVENIATNALDKLMRYHFPGNIRELENLIERGIILAERPTLAAENVMIPNGNANHNHKFDYIDFPYKEAKNLFERQYIKELMNRTNQNISRAAEKAGMDRSNFKDKMRRQGIGPWKN